MTHGNNGYKAVAPSAGLTENECLLFRHNQVIFFIHFSVNELLGCFYVLAIVNSTAVNIGVHDLWGFFFKGPYPRYKEIPRLGV